MNAKQISVAALILFSCGPQPEGKCGGGYVAASLSSVTLGSDCGSSGAVAPDSKFGQCAEGGPCGLCRQSSMHLAFASLSRDASNIEIRAVRLIDPMTGAIETLTSRQPEQWSVDKYIAWNEILLAGSTLKVTYKLSAPQYLGTGSAYKVEVDVAIDGEIRTLKAEATREPEVAT